MQEFVNVVNIITGVFTILGISIISIWRDLRKYLSFRWKLFWQKRKWKTEKDADKKGFIMMVALKQHLEHAKAEIEELRKDGGKLAHLKGMAVTTHELPNRCTPQDAFEAVEWVINIREEMAKDSRRDIHLIYAGPIMILAKIAAKLANSGNIHLYQFNSRAEGEKEYEYWGRLQD